MNSRERVGLALAGKTPDRVPIQFDLCAELLEGFSKKMGVELSYSESYYEDLKYRISGNELRTHMGSDCVVVGGGFPDGSASLGQTVRLND